MPPSSTARQVPRSVQEWRTPPQSRQHPGPMAQQQQQLERVPHQQRLVPQRHVGKQPEPVSREQAEKARKELEKKGQVLPDGQKKKPLPDETAGAA